MEEEARPYQSSVVDQLIGQRIKRVRHSLRMTMQDFADGISMTVEQLKLIEKGQARITSERLNSIAAFTNRNIVNFLPDAPDLDQTSEGDAGESFEEMMSECKRRLDKIESHEVLRNVLSLLRATTIDDGLRREGSKRK